MSTSAETPPRRGRLGRIADAVLGKAVTLVLAALALGLGVATFVVLARQMPAAETGATWIGSAHGSAAVASLLSTGVENVFQKSVTAKFG